MKQYINAFFVVFAMLVLSLTACKKTADVKPLRDGGKTFVKILLGGPSDHTAGQTLTGINFVNSPQTINLAEIRRDPNSSMDLNKPLTVTLQLDTILLKRLNDTLVRQGNDRLLKMPESWYTLSTGGKLGSSFSLTFAAGEISKVIKVTIPNAQLFDPGSTYAFPFRISTVSNAENAVSVQNSLIAKVGAKNAYDGVYELTFSNYHPTSNPGYLGDKVTVHLITTAGDKVKLYWPDEGAFANPALLGGTLTAFGSQEPEYTIVAASNGVTVQNAFAGATTFYTMNPGFNSHYDPAAKKIYAKWGYSYVNGTFALGASREWTQEFRYIGSR